MIYVWIIFMGLFVLVALFFVLVGAYQKHQRRHAIEMRGYRLPGDPNVDPRQANEP